MKPASSLIFLIILSTTSFSHSQEIDTGGDSSSEAAHSALDDTTGPALLPETRVESPAPAVAKPTTQQRSTAPQNPSVKAPASGSPAGVPTVIATKTPRIEVPSTGISTVSELKQYQRFSVNDTLRQMPGTTIIQNGGPGTVTGFNIRGMQSDQNVVLLNGRRLPPGLAGQYQLEFLEVSTLESVQVLRGSASSLYGADAIGGVIDLRSTDARFVENNGLSIYSEGGSFDTFRSGGIASFRDGRIGGVLETATVQTETDRPSSDFENRTFRGDIAFDIRDGVWFDVLGFVQSGDVQVPGSSFQNPNFPEEQKNFNESYLVSPRLTLEGDQWDFSLFYSYNQNDLEAVDTPQFFGFGVDGFLRQIGRETEAVFNYHGMEHGIFSIGGGSYTYQFLQEPIGFNTFVVPASRSYRYDSIFGQADLDLPAHINLVSSVRNDAHDSYRDATTYSVALNKHIPGTGTSLFTRVATGYRAPTGQDLLFIVDPSGINPGDIEPEESLSREVGIRQTMFQDRASLTVTYFHNDFTDSIEFDPTTFGLSTVDGETKGFEIEGSFSPNNQVSAYSNYTYLDTEVTGGAGNLSGRPGERLPRRPRHTFNTGLVFSGDNWDLGAEIHGAIDRFDRSAAPRFADDYMVTRIFGSYDLTENIEWYGRIENLFDEDYIYTRGFEAPGFGAFAGLRVILGE